MVVHLVTTLGFILSVMALVDLEAHTGVTTVGLELLHIGQLEVWVVGLVEMMDTQLVAHVREVFDIAWGGVGVFTSVSIDGLVMVFDLHK